MKQSLIYSRRHDDGILSADEILSRAPAVLSEGHAEGLSARYGEVSTVRAVQILGDFGFYPVQAVQKKTRRPEGRAFAEHLVAFSNPSAEGIARANGERPEILLYNSHDGSSAVRLFVGFYRFVCSNGMVAGEGFEARLRHTAGRVSGFEEMVRELAGKLPELAARIDALKSVSVTRSAALELAERAAALRWDRMPVIDAEPAPGAYYDAGTVSDLLHARRYEDQFGDAFTVLNRIQEGVIRGGSLIRSVTERNPYGATRRARAVGSVSEAVRINRALWDLGTEILGEPAPVAELAVAA